jgi:hypothetical protein
MQRPDQAGGAYAAAAAAGEDAADKVTDRDQETVGADDAVADAVRSGADDEVVSAASETELAGTAWGDDDDAYDDDDQVTAGRDDARADAARSGADPDEV